jgi:cell division transport system permease protein
MCVIIFVVDKKYFEAKVIFLYLCTIMTDMIPNKNKFPYQRRRLRKSYLSTIVSITLVLFVLGLMAALLLNVGYLSRYVKENIGFTVEIADGVSQADIVWLRKQLDVMPAVRETKLISQADAERELRAMLGQDFVSFLGYNPLSIYIEAKLRYSHANSDSLIYIDRRISRMQGVKSIVYQKSLVDVVNRNVNRISAILLLFSILLFVVSLTQINTTIRLSVYSKRFSIYTMKLVGATHAFITRPFLARSALHGVAAALLAFGMLSVLYFFVRKQIDAEILDVISVDFVGLLMACLLILGLLVATISTYFALNRSLSMNMDDLYY